MAAGVRTLVIGAGGGIGAAFVAALAGEQVTGLSRSGPLPVELTDEASLEAAARALGGQDFHRIIVATGALVVDGVGPEKRLEALNAASMSRSFVINAIGPALLLKHFSPLLPRQGRCVFAVLSARVGSIGDNHLGGWYSYRASKAALNQIMRTASIEIARKRPAAIVMALHPGTVRTGLSAPFTAPDQGISAADTATRLLSVMDTARESGVFRDHRGAAIPW